MQKTAQIGKTQRICIQGPEPSEIDQLAKTYNFHEMIVQDIMGINAQSKIDTTSDHFFMALTFTKYLPESGRYVFNEMDVIIGNDLIITTIGLQSSKMDMIFDDIRKDTAAINIPYKTSPYYILYRIVDAFYDKTVKSLAMS